MSDAYTDHGGPGPSPGTHLPGWTLEQLAEEILPPDEQDAAMRHVEACARCAAELEGYRALFAALSDLPRFAPSVGFSDAVIARTRLAPEPGPVVAWLRNFMPKTRRGWALLTAAVVAPALPVLAAALWLITHPLVTPVTLGQWIAIQGRAAGQAAGGQLLQWAQSTGVAGVGMGVYEMIRGIPMEAVTGLVAVLAIAFPLSVWALVRLVRAPMRNAPYANRTV